MDKILFINDKKASMWGENGRYFVLAKRAYNGLSFTYRKMINDTVICQKKII
jgi:hypothetical protein